MGGRHLSNLRNRWRSALQLVLSEVFAKSGDVQKVMNAI